jgi:predicted secreted protein
MRKELQMKITTLIKLMLMLLLTGILTFGFSIQRANGAEPPATEWTKAYGGANSEVARSVIQTSDGGYLLAGETVSFGAGGKDFWLVKTDSSGNMEWNKTYGGTKNDMAFSVVETSGGGYALTGRTNSFGLGIADFWLVKVDSSGGHEWNKTYGGTGVDAARCVVQTSDEGYALAGFTESFGAGGQDFWLVKTDSSGNMEWNKTYGGTGVDAARCVVQTSDGGYILTGETNSFGAGDTDFWLVKVDSSGGHEWNKTYGGPLTESAFSVVEVSDGGYALAGRIRSLGEGRLDFWLVKVDSSGHHEWNKTYGGTGNDPAHSMVEANIVEAGDGGYALAGFTQSFGAGGQDGWLIKTDDSGNMEWNKTYGGTGNDVLNSVAKTGDGGYALVGFTESFGAGGQDFWLVKVASPPEYTLTIDSSPVGITFKVDNESQTTPWLGTYKQGISVSLEMPEIYAGGNPRHYWNQWSDGNTSRSRTVAMNTNITLTAYYGYPPVANFISSPPLPKVEESVTFDASTSLPGWNGTHTMPITEYQWNFGDGNTTTTTTSIIYHSHKTAGNYYVTLTVYAPGATPESDSTTHKVTVISRPVGGYSIPIKDATTTKPLTPYLTIAAILTVAFTTITRKTRRRTTRSWKKRD